MTTELKYIQHYSQALQDQIRQLQAQDKLGDYLQTRYPQSHTVQTSKALYDFCNDIKQTYMRNVSTLAKVAYDSRLTMQHHALGLNTAISRVQGGKLKAKKEIRISDTFKELPEAFLRMIVVHELAHLKERDHSKAFYKLCEHMEPDYHQLEFDCRVHLTWKETV
ncbi:MAG: M48 family metallopeptidase [Methylophilaceae bacterium]